MSRTIWSVARLHFKNIRVAYLVVGICVGLMLVQNIVGAILLRFGIEMSGPDNQTISLGWYLWLLLLNAAIVMPLGNFPRILNLGAKRRDYFWGTLEAYAVLSGATALVGTLWNYLVDRPMTSWGRLGSFWTAPQVFGWDAHGPVGAFLQQWAFLLLFVAFVHTLVAAQDKWYGWTADVVVIAIISVFTPIAPLRHAEAWFFNLILFHPNVFAQIGACLVLAAAFYALSRPVLNRRIA